MFTAAAQNISKAFTVHTSKFVLCAFCTGLRLGILLAGHGSRLSLTNLPSVAKPIHALSGSDSRLPLICTNKPVVKDCQHNKNSPGVSFRGRFAFSGLFPTSATLQSIAAFVLLYYGRPS